MFRPEHPDSLRGGQETAPCTYLANGIQIKVVVIYFKSAHKPSGIADNFVTYHQGCRMANQSLSHVADIVNQIDTGHGVQQQGASPFHCGLQIQAIGIRDAGGSPHGNAVMVIQISTGRKDQAIFGTTVDTGGLGHVHNGHTDARDDGGSF